MHPNKKPTPKQLTIPYENKSLWNGLPEATRLEIKGLLGALMLEWMKATKNEPEHDINDDER